jgi:hypothetical protein
METDFPLVRDKPITTDRLKLLDDAELVSMFSKRDPSTPSKFLSICGAIDEFRRRHPTNWAKTIASQTNRQESNSHRCSQIWQLYESALTDPQIQPDIEILRSLTKSLLMMLGDIAKDRRRDATLALVETVKSQGELPTVKEMKQELVDKRILDEPSETFGAPLTYIGLRHEPLNAQGVVLLFGMVLRKLGFIIEAVRKGSPATCLAKWSLQSGEQQSKEIQFEFRSRDAEKRSRPLTCDILVCWEDDWPACPIEVVELKSILQTSGADLLA